MADIAYFEFGNHDLILFWLVSLDLLLPPLLGLALKEMETFSKGCVAESKEKEESQRLG